MKKREFLKSGILGLGASALALSGCNKPENTTGNIDTTDDFDIIPKQTATYEFSCPLPFDFKVIDEITELNSTLKKSKITSFHNNTPEHLAKTFNHSVQVFRTPNRTLKSYDDFFKYVKYAIDNGYQFTYLMNSPKPFSIDDYDKFKDDVLYILDRLKKVGCRSIKIGNPQVANMINRLAPNEFVFSASTALEYHTHLQYKYLFNNYPNFDLIDVANDENQNFKYLSRLKEMFPKMKLELMVNEPCIKGCPARVSHIAEPIGHEYYCQKLRVDIGYLHFYFKSGFIYPWNLEYYSAIGVNNFKYIAMDFSSDMRIDNTRANFHDLTNLKAYLNCVENGTDNISAIDFFAKIHYKLRDYATALADSRFKNMSLTQLAKEYIPDIKQFIKHGDKCASECGISCDYCYKRAKKLEEAVVLS